MPRIPPLYVERGLEKMKMDELDFRQRLDGHNSWQWVKRAQLYSGLRHTYKNDSLIALGSQQSGYLIALGSQQSEYLIALGSQQSGYLIALGSQQSGYLIALGSQQKGTLISASAIPHRRAEKKKERKMNGEDQKNQT